MTELLAFAERHSWAEWLFLLLTLSAAGVFVRMTIVRRQ